MIKKVFFLFFLFFGASFLAAKQEINVCYYNSAPLIFEKNGQPNGLFFDLLSDAAKKEDWNLKYRFGTLPQCLERLKTGEVDLVPSLSQTKERKIFFDFTNDFFFVNWGLIYTQKNSDIHNIFDLKNKRIGMLQDSIYTEELKSLLQQFGFPAQVIEKNETADIFSALGKGELDAGICGNLYGVLLEDLYPVERTQIVFAPTKLRIAVKKNTNREIIHQLDGYFKKLKDKPNSYYYEKYNEWIGVRTSGNFLKRLKLFLYLLGAVVVILVLFIYLMRLAVKKKTRDLRMANELLCRQEEQYKSLFESSPVAIWEEDFSGVKQYLETLENEIHQDILGYLKKDSVDIIDFLKRVRIVDLNRANLNLYKASSKEELIEKLPLTFIPESKITLAQQIIAIYRHEKIFYSESMIRTLQGKLKNIYFQWQVLSGFEKTYQRVLISIVDITELKHKEKELQVSLNEKEVLLNEIHHRVKNNLQIISALLQLGMGRVNDPAANAVLKESIDRIETIALIHKQLYSRENFASIQVEKYIKELLGMLIVYYESDKRISLEVSCPSVELNMNLMLPIGLIINELATNSLKHAFLNRTEGRLAVLAEEKEDCMIELSYRDDGPGLPAGFNLSKCESFGFQIIKNLLKQIKGTVEIKNDGGLWVQLRFRKN